MFSPRYPQTNGRVENAFITCAFKDKRDPTWQLEWINTQFKHLKLKPVQMMFSRPTRSIISINKVLLRPERAIFASNRLSVAKILYDRDAKE